MEIRVTVTPGARKEKVVRVDHATLAIAVREPAERNLANSRVREIVAEEFSVPVSRTRVVRGHRSQKKVIRIT